MFGNEDFRIIYLFSGGYGSKSGIKYKGIVGYNNGGYGNSYREANTEQLKMAAPDSYQMQMQDTMVSTLVLQLIFDH